MRTELLKEVQILYVAEVCYAETPLFLACVSLNLWTQYSRYRLTLCVFQNPGCVSDAWLHHWDFCFRRTESGWCICMFLWFPMDDAQPGLRPGLRYQTSLVLSLCIHWSLALELHDPSTARKLSYQYQPYKGALAVNLVLTWHSSSSSWISPHLVFFFLWSLG